MSEKQLIQEIIRLLLYVAWADDEIAPEEYDYLLRLARDTGFSDLEVNSVDKAMRDRSSLRRPDIEMLKPHRSEVLSHVRKLIRADDHIALAEADILHKIAAELA
ncbi:MAG: TerB family tellurite resistance protein [Myxococcales bacterium]|nr:TerB family tellurite resistance protein [Myxococcales bacterium]